MKITIHSNRIRDCGDTLHEKRNKLAWKPKLQEELL
jgi:hypothetical protein